MAKVLIVDDSLTVRLQLGKILTGAGHKVIETSTLSDAISQIAAATDISLLIVDYHLGAETGFELISTVRQRFPAGSFKIFMLTTEASMKMRHEGKKLGVNAWIVKPVNPDDLIQAIDMLDKAG